MKMLITLALGRQQALLFLENMQGELPLGDLPAGLHFVLFIVEGKVVGTERLLVVGG